MAAWLPTLHACTESGSHSRHSTVCTGLLSVTHSERIYVSNYRPLLIIPRKNCKQTLNLRSYGLLTTVSVWIINQGTEFVFIHCVKSVIIAIWSNGVNCLKCLKNYSKVGKLESLTKWRILFKIWTIGCVLSIWGSVYIKYT